MDAVKAPATPTHSLRQWRNHTAPNDTNDTEDGLGMCLPIGLKQEKPPLRPKQIPLTDEEIRDLETDTTLDKGYTVWRSLPMESDLDKKLKAGQLTNRTANFTKEAKPEAYCPGFSSRAGGPISRPHRSPTRATKPRPLPAQQPIKTAQVEQPIKAPHSQHTANATNAQLPPPSEGSGIRARREASDMSTSSSVDGPVPRPSHQNQGGVLKDSVLRQQKTGS